MADTLRVFIGYDPRQALAYTVLQHSILLRASKPVQITPLVIDHLPIEKVGLTPFTYTRFLVPWLCDFEGWALFLDSDMLALGDINELFEMADDKYACMVVKNEKRFEWASLILYNCSKLGHMTPEYVEKLEKPHLIDWVEREDDIGALPAEWNHLVGYDPPRFAAKLIHYTQGIPAHPECKGCEFTEEWMREQVLANYTLPWEAVMGRSVHVAMAGDRMLPKFRLGMR